MLLRSVFCDVERISVFEARDGSLEEIVARALSFSANSPASLGEEGRAAYEAQVRERMLAIVPDGDVPGDRRERRHHRAPRQSRDRGRP